MAYDELSKPLSVSEANRLIKETLHESFYQIMIIGEISSFRPAASGHWYFDLKDKDASISSAVFKTMQYNMPSVKNGDLVIAAGRIDYWEKTGKISFIITNMARKGDGELKALIEKKKQYYQSLGWFDIDKKKPMPKTIKKLGVVTSPTGAALQDILNITRRRAPALDIIVFPCQVQGDGAATTIASRIRQANNFNAADILIVGRGGGSQEDLACFSDDEVIEAIHQSRIPVISAVGHEIDFPLSDYVADFRAPTPSAAAELATEAIFKRKERLDSIIKDIVISINSRIVEVERRIAATRTIKDMLEKRILVVSSSIKDKAELSNRIERKIDHLQFKASMTEDSIHAAFSSSFENGKMRVQSLEKDFVLHFLDKSKNAFSSISELRKEAENALKAKLKDGIAKTSALEKEALALSPLSILERGYAFVQDKNGRVLRDPKELSAGDEVTTRLHKGVFTSIVKER